MKERRVSRWKAAGIHLSLSVLVAIVALLSIRFLWYPGALFGAAGGLTLFLLIAGVDVAIGPLCTLVVFKQGKKGLAFDLATIAVLQLAALSYGSWVLFESRPAWIVFTVDRFELVRANDVLPDEMRKAKPPYDRIPLTGPRVVAVVKPKNPDEQLRLITAGLQGKDLQLFPQHYVPYFNVAADVAAHAQRLGELDRFNPGRSAEIAALPAKFGKSEAQLGFLPMRAGKADLAVLVDRSSGSYLGIVALKPWQY
jgi:hypothetical protein